MVTKYETDREELPAVVTYDEITIASEAWTICMILFWFLMFLLAVGGTLFCIGRCLYLRRKRELKGYCECEDSATASGSGWEPKETDKLLS